MGKKKKEVRAAKKREADILALSKSTKQKVHAEKRRATIIGLAMLALVVLVIGVGAWYAIGYLLSSPPASEQHRPGQIVMHIHPRLTIRILGQNYLIPANIGLDPNLWQSHQNDGSGMTGMSPLHTHDTSGTIHVESTVVRDYTLGDFLAVWGVVFNSQCIMQYCADATRKLKMFVNGQPNLDFEKLILRDGQQILIEYG